jgi:thioredoxin reductase (NADPH)
VTTHDGVPADHQFDFDLVVIGGGSGGLACAQAASKLGARVACLDFVKPTIHGTTWGLGGTCVNVGCIPKKLMHNAAIIRELMHDGADFGWNVPQVAHNWQTLVTRVQEHIQSLNFGYRVQLREASVNYMNKLGRFVDAHHIECTDKKGKTNVISAARFVIAVGGRPTPLACPGAELAITSDDLFSLEKPPGKTCVVGAGYVALECAGFLKAFGFDVTVSVRSILLRGFDRECANKIHDHMQNLGIRFLLETLPASIERTADGRLKVTFTNGQEDTFDTVLAAIGRTADTAGLNLEAVGVMVNPTNLKLPANNEQTNVSHIYAVGDVLDGRPELTPVAIMVR